MMNPNQMQNSQPLFNENTKQLIQQIKNCGNPQQMVENIVQQNPQLGIINLLGQCGGNAKKAFYMYAKQKGINPDDIINMLS